MLRLILINAMIIAFTIGLMFLFKKKVKNEKTIYLILLISSIVTIVSHYSGLLFHFIEGGTLSMMRHLKENPNLLLPIYPCNVVMWCCLIFGLVKDKHTRFSDFLVDLIFYFGLPACLVGMFANVDFIRALEAGNTNNFDALKSTFSHGFMLINVAAVWTFGYVKIDLKNNMVHILLTIITLLICGLYCSIVSLTLVSEKSCYLWNSMFLLHSPFGEGKFLTFPIISVLIIILYFGLFNFLELLKYGKDNMWYKRLKKK